MAKHTITIEDDLYEKLQEFCKLNDLKISAYCNTLIKKSFINEKFGNIPFGVINDTSNENYDIPDVIRMHALKTLQREKESESEISQNIPIENTNDIKDEVIEETIVEKENVTAKNTEENIKPTVKRTLKRRL